MGLVNLKWLSRFSLGAKVSLFYPLYSAYYKFYQDPAQRNINLFSKSNTQIVIEGYPRSANSSAVAHFNSFNSEINIAHYHHVPAQIIKGVSCKIPVIVLIRNPIEAIASFKSYEPQLSLTVALKAYTSFYNTILPYKSGFVVASFPRVFSEFDDIVKQVNRKFKTKFNAATPIQFLSHETDPTNKKARMELKSAKYDSLVRSAFDLYQIYLNLEDKQMLTIEKSNSDERIML